MRRPAIALLLLLILHRTSLSAQNSECAPCSALTQTARVCNAAVDAARAFHPLVGLLTSGGNPVLGRAGSLGGLGRFAITARANGTKVVLPDPTYDGSTAVVPKEDELFFPSPLVEGALGIADGRGSVGLGHDWYGGAASIQFREPLTSAIVPVALDLETSRTLVFANAGLELGAVRLVGEAGYQFGKDQNITTVFQDFDPASGRFFAAAGLQFGL